MAKTEGMTGLQKAAVLMISLGPDASAKILSNLSTDAIERLSMEIARIEEEIPSDVRDDIVREFYQTHLASKYLEQGGIEYARQLLEKSLSPEDAAKILAALENSIQQTPFHFLKMADTEHLVMYIQDEHPQTISLIMAHLPPKKAAEVLHGLSPKKQLEVIKRISRMEQTTPEAIRQVEQGLESRLASIVTQSLESAGGVQSVAEILNLSDRTTERGILENLEEADPDMVEHIRKLMFVFEDLVLVDDKGIQNMLREIDQQELAKALKKSSDLLKEKIFRNMSAGRARMVEEAMEFMGPLRLSEVEEAQQRIVDVIRRLESENNAVISGRGGEDSMIV